VQICRRGALIAVSRPDWLEVSELRVGLGCMRMSTDDQRDEQLALDTIAAAAAAGVTVFDTARAYGGEGELGHNERLLARALRLAGAEQSARVVTKGGMTRPGGAWVPDGRAKAIRADCEASVAALDGLPIDLYLLHAADPRTPWRTSVRALARLVDDGLVARVGLSNVNRSQLDEAAQLAPVAAVQVAMSLFDDRAVRGGLVERCDELGIALLAHSPLGGPRRAGGLGRNDALVQVAQGRGATPAEIALAWLVGLSPAIVAIPGARRPETARSAARAAGIVLSDRERAALGRAFTHHRPQPARRRRDGEVVLIMGIPGAGKSRLAAGYLTRNYARLNRDERGGSLRELAQALDEQLASGISRVVLDSTYLTRASRSYVIESAASHGVPARCVWLDTPLAQAQVNLVQRLLDRFGSLPMPDELRALAKREQGLLMPTSQMRALRELEPPSVDEGWASVQRLAFEREPEAGRAGVFVAAAAVPQALEHTDRDAPYLIFDWDPDGNSERVESAAALLRTEVSAPVEAVLCPHAAGPPACWCRPPLPGLPLAFARANAIDPAGSLVVGTGPAHRTLAAALGARYVSA
jgi:aryl-alcohol dehydrogenase-like predicted oxidoreductase